MIARVPVRTLTSGDAAWAAALMERRRQEYARYSPVFWRPAEEGSSPPRALSPRTHHVIDAFNCDQVIVDHVDDPILSET